MTSKNEKITELKNKINSYFLEANRLSSKGVATEEKDKYFKENSPSIAQSLDDLRKINATDIQSINNMANTAYKITPENHKGVFLNTSLLNDPLFVMDNIKDYKIYPLISEEIRKNSLLTQGMLYHLNNGTIYDFHDEKNKKLICKIYSAVPDELKNSETFKPIIMCNESDLDKVPKAMFQKIDVVYEALKDAINNENRLAIFYIFANTTEETANFLEESFLQSYKTLPKAIQIKEKNIFMAIDYSVENILYIPEELKIDDMNKKLQKTILQKIKDTVLPNIKEKISSTTKHKHDEMHNSILQRIKINKIFNLINQEQPLEDNLEKRFEKLEEAIDIKIDVKESNSISTQYKFKK